jgi:hypothetical protein
MQNYQPNFGTLLIGAEGTKTPAGVRSRRDPAGASAKEARRNACGKRSAWSGNQQNPDLKENYIRKGYLLESSQL